MTNKSVWFLVWSLVLGLALLGVIWLLWVAVWLWKEFWKSKTRFWWWLRYMVRSLVPYPLRAMRLEVAFHPFTVLGGTWFDWVNRNRTMSDQDKRNGETIWWLRLGPITVSYGRML